MKQLIHFVWLTVSMTAAAQVAIAQETYRADAIPAALRENAHSVLRRQEETYEVKSPGEAMQYGHYVLTILDEKGDDEATLTLPYSKLLKIKDISGVLYDASGKTVRRLKKSDINDISSYADGNFADDSRYRIARFADPPAYPYTVEFQYEMQDLNLMNYPRWQPQDAASTAVEQAMFTVLMPPGLPLRYKEFNLKTPARVTDEANGGKRYVWQAENVAVAEPEPHQPAARDRLPGVWTAPSRFAVQGYEGDFTTWADFGKFYHALNQSRDALPTNVVAQARTLTAGETTTAGKARKIYAFLQENTRYISIQLGIGGWQTIPATDVADKQYGDCKALTNYAKALLSAVNVPAYATLIGAGDGRPDVLTDFPSNQFNHVILCVPDGRDTLWLECTSQTEAFGYLSDFTSGRHGLIVTPDGGRLAKTPTYGPSDNRQHLRATVRLTPEGDASVTAQTRYTGLQQDARAQLLASRSPDEQRTWLLKQLSLPSFELEKFRLSQAKTRLPAVTEDLTLNVKRWATPSGTRLLLPLNRLTGHEAPAPATRARTQPLDLSAQLAYVDTDSVTFVLPAGYKLEGQTAPIHIDAPFGQYVSEVRATAGQLLYTRRLEMRRGRYPADAYTNWLDFRRKVARADRQQLMLVREDVVAK